MTKMDDKSLELWKEIGVGCKDSAERTSLSQLTGSRLLQMPPEILEQIFQNVDRVTRITLRLVCKYIKKFMDRVMGMYLIINDQHQPQEALNFFSRIVIRKAVVENATFTRFHSLFTMPQYVDAMFLDGEIQASFLIDILKSCSKLRILILLGEIQGILPVPSDSHQTSPLLFQRQSLFHLKSIDFRIAYNTTVFESVPYEDSQQICFNMMHFLKILHAPNLETCCLDSWITLPFDEAQVMDILISFLALHKTLKGLLISFRMVEQDFGGGRHAFHLKDKEQQLALKLEKLGQLLQLSTCIISTIPLCSLWGHFLRGQKALKTLSFCDRTCSWGICEAPVRNNWELLGVIYILMDLQCQLDFTIFAQCCRLRELILINASARDITTGAPKDVSGLEKILVCKHLNFCAFSNLIIDRNELWKLTKLEKLEALALLSSGFGYDTGVDLQLLQGLLACSRLDAVLIDGTVAVDMEEANKIYEIIQRLSENYPGDENDVSVVQPGVINIRPTFGTFNKWTSNPQGDGFFFNMEFDHQNV